MLAIRLPKHLTSYVRDEVSSLFRAGIAKNSQYPSELVAGKPSAYRRWRTTQTNGLKFARVQSLRQGTPPRTRPTARVGQAQWWPTSREVAGPWRGPGASSLPGERGPQVRTSQLLPAQGDPGFSNVSLAAGGATTRTTTAATYTITIFTKNH